MMLRPTQHLFWRSVRFDPAPPEVDEVFVDHGELTGRERMAIYRDMYWARQVGALALAFERLSTLLGEEAFTKLAVRYIRRHPSEHGALERLGRHMGPFLLVEGHPAWIVDLGRLEWQRIAALIHPEGPAATGPAAIDPDRFASQAPRFSGHLAMLRLHASALHLAHLLDLGQIDEARVHLEGLEAGRIEHREVPVAVWRQGFSVRHASLSPEEAEALILGRDGATLGEICTAFARAEDPVAAAFAVLLPWFERQWITHLDLPETP